MTLTSEPATVETDEVSFRVGYSHLAFATGSKDQVDQLTERLRRDGYAVVSEPRTTGDGYYESCVLDLDGNRVEITI